MPTKLFGLILYQHCCLQAQTIHFLSKINSCLVGASLSADLANRYILTIVAYFTGLEAVFGIFLLPTTYKSLPSVNKELPSKDSSSS